MTLLTFAKAMLGDQLAKYGFEHRRNMTWVKVSDEGIYFTVSFKKYKLFEDYYAKIYFNMQPVFSKLYNYEYRLADWYRYMKEAGLIPSEIANRIPVGDILMVEETDPRYESMLEKGRILFSAVLEPILVNVHDMDSCYAANFELNYIAYKPIREIRVKTDTRVKMKNVDRSNYSMIYTHNTFPMVHCLCKAKRYSDALKLLQNCGKMGSLCFEEGSITLGQFYEETSMTEGYKLWYIERLEEGNCSEIEGVMKAWYEYNCEELKKKYGLSVKYELETEH